MAAWVRTSELPWSQVDDEIVLLDTATGNYFGLNRVAAYVWSLLDQPRSLEDIVSGVCDKYDVPREQCSRDVRALLDNLVHQKFAKQCP